MDKDYVKGNEKNTTGDLSGRPLVDGFKTTNRFNIASFSNGKNVSKGFTNKRIAFYNNNRH